MLDKTKDAKAHVDKEAMRKAAKDLQDHVVSGASPSSVEESAFNGSDDAMVKDTDESTGAVQDAEEAAAVSEEEESKTEESNVEEPQQANDSADDVLDKTVHAKAPVDKEAMRKAAKDLQDHVVSGASPSSVEESAFNGSDDAMVKDTDESTGAVQDAEEAAAVSEEEESKTEESNVEEPQQANDSADDVLDKTVHAKAPVDKEAMRKAAMDLQRDIVTAAEPRSEEEEQDSKVEESKEEEVEDTKEEESNDEAVRDDVEVRVADDADVIKKAEDAINEARAVEVEESQPSSRVVGDTARKEEEEEPMSHAEEEMSVQDRIASARKDLADCHRAMSRGSSDRAEYLAHQAFWCRARAHMDEQPCVPATFWFEGSMDPRPKCKKPAPALPAGVSTPKAMPPPAIKDLKAPEPVLEHTVLGVPDGPAVETKSRRLASNYAVT